MTASYAGLKHLAVKPHARRSYVELVRQLGDTHDAGRAVPCETDPDSWLAEDVRTRREAAAACSWCPVIAACQSYAETAPERRGVWGGVDRNRAARGRLPTTTPPRPTTDEETRHAVGSHATV